MLFEQLIDNDEQKQLASQCCSSTNDENNQCYNFVSKSKKDHPLVYGYSKYGYVNDTKCVTSDYYDQPLDVLFLSKFDESSSFDKNKLLETVYQLLSYYKVMDNTKPKTLQAINLVELINLKVLLETDSIESIFFSLVSEIKQQQMNLRIKNY